MWHDSTTEWPGRLFLFFSRTGEVRAVAAADFQIFNLSCLSYPSGGQHLSTSATSLKANEWVDLLGLDPQGPAHPLLISQSL